jgi:hypothetical protein
MDPKNQQLLITSSTTVWVPLSSPPQLCPPCSQAFIGITIYTPKTQSHWALMDSFLFQNLHKVLFSQLPFPDHKKQANASL